MLYKLHPYQVTRHVITPKENPVSIPISSSPQASGATNLLSVSMDLSIADISYKQNHTINDFCIRSLSLDNVVQIHPCCKTCLRILFLFMDAIFWIFYAIFYGCTIFHCMDIPQFIYPFTHSWTWELISSSGYCE